MNPHEELRELIIQAREHLRYFRELGLTEIGETVIPPDFKKNEPVEQTAGKDIQLLSMPVKKDTAITSPEPLSAGSAAQPLEEKYQGETLDDIRRDLGDCRRCKLWSTRTNLVFGEGDPNAALMFVGEGPGADEDASGRPFIGRAGQLLTKMIEAIDMKREDVFIANVVKSRPPENRAPEKDESDACIPFLFRQINAIRPKLIVALGNPAMQSLLNTKEGITRMRGKLADYPRIDGIKVIPTFHPAYLLRSPDKKKEAWEDMKRVRDFLAGKL